MKIRADVHSDDWAHEVVFNALPWFESGSEHELVKLMACDFGGDYPADAVAEFFAVHSKGRAAHFLPAIADLFDHCREHDVGFECHVREEDAIAWLVRERPAALIQHRNPVTAARAVPRLPRADVERLLEHDAREIRVAAILALGKVRKDAPKRPSQAP